MVEYISLLDRQRLQQEFEARKEARALQLATQINSLQNPISPKDLLMLNMQQAENNRDQAFRYAQLDQQAEENALNRQNRLDLNNDKILEKREKEQEKKDLKKRLDQNLLSNSLSAIDEQISLVDRIIGPEGKEPIEGLEGNFGMAGYFPNTRGGKSANASTLLDRLEAQTFMKTLGDMKSQSATGASGLGALSEREGEKVQAASASLAREQDLPSFVGNALQYRRELEESKKRLKSGFENIYKVQNAPSPQFDVNSLSLEDLLAEKQRRSGGGN